MSDNAFEGPAGRPLVATSRDAGVVVEGCFASHAAGALLYPENLPPAFFDLSSGDAGAVLQELRNYGIRLALVCAPGAVRFSTHFPEMVREERAGRWFRVFENRESALAWLRG